MARPAFRIGCAGWSIPKAHSGLFPAAGSHLARYAAVFNAVEINSSFSRFHQESSYARWAATVPADFRFAVKVHRTITHDHRLQPTPALQEFLRGPLRLGDRLGPLLVQLPPSLALEPRVVCAFCAALRARFRHAVVAEPRHPSWFTAEGEELLAEFEIGRVAVDPARPVPEAAEPGGWRGIAYYRLHGSPELYRSAYPEAFLSRLAERLDGQRAARPVWVIFDNTAAGAHIPNASWLQARLRA
jgi:uncharacterized protein YecE (DUF72 family)